MNFKNIITRRPVNKNQKKTNNKFKLKSGDLLYYFQFYPFKTKVAQALMCTTREALEPYFTFLNTAIELEKEKCTYEIKWKKVDSKYRIKLTPIIRKLKIEKTNPYIEIQMTEEIEVSFKEEKNRLVFDNQDKMETFSKNDLIKDKEKLIIFTKDYLKDNGKICPKDNEKIDTNNIEVKDKEKLIIFTKNYPKDNEKIDINNIEVKYKLKDIYLDKNSKLLNEKGEKIDIKNIYNLEDGWDLEINLNNNIPKELFILGNKLKFKLYNSRGFEKLYEDSNNVFEFENIGNDYIVKKLPDSKKLRNEYGEIYTWSKISKEKEEFILQLIDDDNQEGKAISEYFFDDEVDKIYQDEPKNSYSIKRKIFNEKMLILKKPKNHNIKTISLDQKKPIKIFVNTANLERQRASIRNLNFYPVKDQRKLIRLFENKEKSSWESPKRTTIDNWYILNDDSYDGIIKQREFVKKALETDDFAILEGPPGSGKTTVILELILQIVKERKKILLSASTHVAIDNVLERIKEADKDDLIEALRIGDVNRIDESVKEYQIDTKIEKYKKNGIDSKTAERLTIDSANLVCGTTMGIQRYFNIKNKGKNMKMNLLPVNPIFDYMIIDESSKTTFQEFIVPALYTKKWVLVGDIKQLSPYIEQSHIVHNLRASVPYCSQQAIRLIFEALLNNCNPYIIEVEKNVMEAAKSYWQYWSLSENNYYEDKIISFVESSTKINSKLLFDFLASDLILIEKNKWNNFKKYLPKTHILIKKEDIEDYDYLFEQLYLKEKSQLPKYRAINTNKSSVNNPIEYADYFSSMLEEKDWAEEIAWRMIRVYERRMLKKTDSYYEKTFKLLKPVHKDNTVDRIYNMTLPSILESLQKGNGEKHRYGTSEKYRYLKTTITEGFNKKDLELRHVILEYQYRMHPEISKFSRDQFYTVDDSIALKDSSKISREWDYHIYKSHNIWIDITKKEKNTNDRRNMLEVKRTIEELKKFIDFAKVNKHPNGKKWTVGIITFYRPQESLFREELRRYCNKPNTISRFSKDGVNILNYTVDKFQGMEADIIFLSMVRGEKIGFLDNINRLNVALTRARFQRVILGDNKFFKTQKNSEELEMLAKKCEVIK